MFAVCEFQGSTLQTLQKLMSQQSHVECMVRHIILEVKILLCSLLYQKLYFFGILRFLFLIVSARCLLVYQNPKPFPLPPSPKKVSLVIFYHLLLHAVLFYFLSTGTVCISLLSLIASCLLFF